MTIRDNIYKKHKQGGEAWATLSEDMLPEFFEYIEKTTFPQKNVLDIGCGNWRYLEYLAKQNFAINGIDSSETAIQLAKEKLGTDKNIVCKDMYTMEITPETFDLIISIKTIHHGKKEQIADLIEKIYHALNEGWKIFITLPSKQESNHRSSFKDREEIAPGTFIPLSWPEKWLAHSFFDEDEVQNIFQKFRNTTIRLDTLWHRIITGEK